jgi:hypothetical protein
MISSPHLRAAAYTASTNVSSGIGKHVTGLYSGSKLLRGVKEAQDVLRRSWHQYSQSRNITSLRSGSA